MNLEPQDLPGQTLGGEVITFLLGVLWRVKEVTGNLLEQGGIGCSSGKRTSTGISTGLLLSWLCQPGVSNSEILLLPCDFI